MIPIRTSVRPRVFNKIFPPLSASHPLIDQRCEPCERLFEEGDRLAAVILGPALHEAEAASRGRYYTAMCEPVHWQCTGWTEEEIEDGTALK